MITNQDWWPDQLNLKVLRIPISVMVGTAISVSSPLFGQSVGDTPSVNSERGTAQNGQNNAKGEVFAYLGLADPVGEFQNHVNRGYGAGLGGLLFLGEYRLWGLRAEATYVEYGREVQILQILRTPHLHRCQNHLLYFFRRIGAAVLPEDWAYQAVPLWDYRLLRLQHQDGGRRRLPFHRYR